MTHSIIFQDSTGLQILMEDKKSTDSNIVREVAILTAIQENYKLISITQVFL